MLQSEKKSIYRFIIIYLISTLSLFFVASWFYYTFAKGNIINQQKEQLNFYANKIKKELRELHRSESKTLYYPKIKGINSAIYDIDKKYIFGTFKNKPKLNIFTKNHLNFILNIEPYYLGAAYILVSKKINTTPIKRLQKEIIIFLLIVTLLIIILAYFLSKLFIAPMKDAIKKMDRFIQDATHELNTPISTILTNIEMIELLKKAKDAKDELKRVEIASKTLSKIYNDLVYLNLKKEYNKHIENINFSNLIEERLNYFNSMIQAKNIHLITNIQENIIIKIDKNDALRLIDNLFSNAIKYNLPKGMLYITLNSKEFIVKDSGIGINKKDIDKITQRFTRVDKSEGGFGIGLNIVNQIVNRYKYEFKISSKKNFGTKVVIKWVK